MDQISIFIGSEENVDDIVEFLNEHFLPHEPMNMSIDLVPAGYRIPFFDDMVKKQITKKENLVVMARDGQQLLGRVATKIFEGFGEALFMEFIKGREPASSVHYTRPGTCINHPLH